MKLTLFRILAVLIFSALIFDFCYKRGPLYLRYNDIIPSQVEHLYFFDVRVLDHRRPKGTTLTSDEQNQLFDLLKQTRYRRKSIFLQVLDVPFLRSSGNFGMPRYIISGVEGCKPIWVCNLRSDGSFFPYYYLPDKTLQDKLHNLVSLLKERSLNPDDELIQFLNEVWFKKDDE